MQYLRIKPIKFTNYILKGLEIDTGSLVEVFLWLHTKHFLIGLLLVLFTV
jgi:hypothetical protein